MFTKQVCYRIGQVFYVAPNHASVHACCGVRWKPYVEGAGANPTLDTALRKLAYRPSAFGKNYSQANFYLFKNRLGIKIFLKLSDFFNHILFKN